MNCLKYILNMETILLNTEEKMENTISSLETRFANVRAGRANPNMLDGISVEYYGAPTPLKQLANISVPEARQLSVKPFDKSILGDIEKAIFEANIGLTPNNNGEVIFMVIPALTEDRRRELVKQVKEYASKENAKVVSLCAKVEEELSELSPEDKQEMLEGLGLDGSGLDKLITATYDILGLATYFTVGKDEVRAWTFKKGMNAKQCAGIIHTDFEKGFIRAEVMSYEDLIECGSELKVKEAGKARLEGKDYLMQDGDICHFRFNV